MPSGAEGRHSCSDSEQVVYLRRLRSTQPFVLNRWKNRVSAVTTAGVKAGDAASAGWQVTRCNGAGALAQTATLHLPFLLFKL